MLQVFKGNRNVELGWQRDRYFVPSIALGRSFLFIIYRGTKMLDVKMIRQNFEEVKTKLSTRGVPAEILTRFLTLMKNAVNC